MKLFRRYKERVEELRRLDMTEEQRQAEEYQKACSQVTLLTRQLEELDREAEVTMKNFNARPGFPRPFCMSGQFGDQDVLTEWWDNYKVRYDAVRIARNNALLLAGSLKASN